MSTRRLSDALEELRKGGSFDVFANATKEDFDRMSRDIFKCWKLPPGVDQEDVRQELFLALYEKDVFARYDASRGQAFAKFVVWQTYTSAKRYCHRQRSALRRSGSAPSRHPIAFSCLAGEAYEGRAADLGLEGETEDDQEELTRLDRIGTEVRSMLGSKRHRVAFDALRECTGSIGDAARMIAEDARVAFAAEVCGQDEAEMLVQEVIDEIRGLVRDLVREKTNAA